LPVSPKKGQAVPAGAGDGNSNRAERGITPVLKSEPIRENLDQKGPPFPLPVEQGAAGGNPLAAGSRRRAL